MKCFVCKKYINPKRSGYSQAIFHTRNGFLQHLTWCVDCGENRRNEVNKEYDRRQAISDEYIKEQYKLLGIEED